MLVWWISLVVIGAHCPIEATHYLHPAHCSSQPRTCLDSLCSLQQRNLTLALYQAMSECFLEFHREAVRCTWSWTQTQLCPTLEEVDPLHVHTLRRWTRQTLDGEFSPLCPLEKQNCCVVAWARRLLIRDLVSDNPRGLDALAWNAANQALDRLVRACEVHEVHCSVLAFEAAASLGMSLG